MKGHTHVHGMSRTGSVMALAFLLLGCAQQPGTHLTVLLYRVWRVNARGQISLFPYPFPDGDRSSVQGSTAPLPSPNKRWIAFGSPSGDYDVHLLDTRTLRQRRITQLGMPPTINSVSVDVLIDGWSPDSRRLLLYVTRGEDTSEEGDLKVPAACYGFREYDVASGKLLSVALPKEFQFVAWLRDGRFVGVIPGRLPREDTLVLLRAGETQGEPIGTATQYPGQASVSADGRWLVTVARIERPGAAQIVKINVATMSAAPLVSLASWSGNERPTLSQDDKHVAYKRQMRIVNHNPQESLFVDSREIYPCAGMIEYKWIDSQRIALACQSRMLLLDSTTGEILSQYSLQSGSARH